MIAAALLGVVGALVLVGRALASLAAMARQLEERRDTLAEAQAEANALQNQAMARQLREALKQTETLASRGSDQTEAVRSLMIEQQRLQGQIIEAFQALAKAQGEQAAVQQAQLDAQTQHAANSQRDLRATGQSLVRSLDQLTQATVAVNAGEQGEALVEAMGQLAGSSGEQGEALVEAMGRLVESSSNQQALIASASRQNEALVAALQRLTKATEEQRQIAQRTEVSSAELADVTRVASAGDRELRGQLTEALEKLSALQAQSSAVQNQLLQAHMESNHLHQRDLAERSAAPRAKVILREWTEVTIPEQVAATKGTAKPIVLTFPDVDEMELIAYRRAAEMLAEEPQVKKLAVGNNRVTFIWDSSPWGKPKGTRPAALR